MIVFLFGEGVQGFHKKVSVHDGFVKAKSQWVVGHEVVGGGLCKISDMILEQKCMIIVRVMQELNDLGPYSTNAIGDLHMNRVDTFSMFQASFFEVTILEQYFLLCTKAYIPNNSYNAQ